MTSTRAALMIALITTACTSEPAARTDSVAIVAPGVSDSTAGTTQPADSLSPAGPNVPPGNPTPTTWTVDEFGIGGLRAGMTVPEAARMVGGSFAAPATGVDGSSCTYAVWREAPSDVTVMIADGLVARVDVARASKVATSKGARIGDSEARILDLYKGRTAVTPHKYTDGHYITVTPPAASGEGRAYRLVFETDGKKVTRYRGGKQPHVEYVEGCS